ncbi:caspase domain-containing protein [Rhodofomes roseus]|uniref:Caspase domain-containing protein n=1 Tax=Rhodofomes roseus TaxID=34475 RepID=A0ABQ8KB34_9APHY|nr:caspase domain-containing protein [Rhodofomes roseus]KAH9834619.1 caspase domain-containing protein [Rhodofomes roseus]
MSESIGPPSGRHAIPAEYKRLFALVIGVNKYSNTAIPSLQGAVPDAEAVVDYLRTKLQVPTDHVRCLLDDSATRAAIIDQFLQMQKDTRIEAGDPILVYYAGHGGEAKPPSTWPETSDIQTLIPHDFGTTVDGQTVHGIPDYTLGALLSRLAETKGDNITVILDCCHSGSGTRTTDADSTRLGRGVNVPDTLSNGLDESILSQGLSGGTRHAEIASGFLRRGLRSHVLLAACGSKEVAMEEQRRGVFTVALLRTLSTVGAHQVTYRDLLRQMYALPGQNPQCEGYFQDRILFNTKLSASRPFHSVRRDATAYTLEAGSINGVTLDSRYAVYNTRDGPALGISPLAYLRVSEVHPAESTLVTISDQPVFVLGLGQSAYALQTEAGTDQYLQLYVTEDERRSFLLHARTDHAQNGLVSRSAIFRLVEKTSADLEVTMDTSAMQFTMLHPLIATRGLQRLPFPVDLSSDDVYETLHAASRFFWHLKRTSPQPSLQQQVRIEFRRLREVPAEDEFDDPIYEPYGPDLNVAGTVDLIVDDDAMYGITLINETHIPLYPSLFYFGSSDLSITSYFEPPTAGTARVDPPLEPNGTLPIGYGSAGAAPYNYYLWKDQQLDVGFLKLFLSTEYVDLLHVAQGSPFHGDYRGARMVPSLSRALLWDTSLVTIVQRARPAGGE